MQCKVFACYFLLAFKGFEVLQRLQNSFLVNFTSFWGREPPEEGLMCELLWSDPAAEPGRSPSKRGVGVAFGEDVTRAFLEANGLDLLVRSHEVTALQLLLLLCTPSAPAQNPLCAHAVEGRRLI